MKPLIGQAQITKVTYAGAFHYFAQSSAVAPVEEGGRRRKDLCQE